MKSWLMPIKQCRKEENSMTGKETCKTLKEIRAKIAEANEIPWVIEDCPYEGECRGTCPKCEAEVEELMEALKRRAEEGKQVTLKDMTSIPLKKGKEQYRVTPFSKPPFDPPPLQGYLIHRPPIDPPSQRKRKRRRKKRRNWLSKLFGIGKRRKK